ncbi:MAG: pre-peptidase C-terminal domain-containing protein [Acidobacteria bacterium]|nr:pre-peptidase C-terminal domain-containing protein [Acidobacteriota bacterium]
MTSRRLSNSHGISLHRFVIGCSFVFIIALTISIAITHRSFSAGATGKRQTLSFEERVAAQRAIEEVYWRHRIWPKDNPQPKPSLDAVMPESALRAKVEDYLRMSNALEQYWQRPVTGEQLQAEMDRMARQTKQPDVLHELWAALGNDPLVIAECLARPSLAGRLLRESYLAKALTQTASDDWWNRVKEKIPAEIQVLATAYHLPEIAIALGPCDGELWTPTNTTGAPERRGNHSAVWTGSEMIIWGGFNPGPLSTGSRYTPAIDSWTPTSLTGVPIARLAHTAVWTGIEMIIWGGSPGDIVFGRTNTGGRYNPATDSWTATSLTGAPEVRSIHTAVWTGSEMIIWGGNNSINGTLNNGSRYNPTTDAWTTVTTTGAPSQRYAHTAVWTGSEMIVWGGFPTTSTGGRYNPATNAWAPTTTSGAPFARNSHTAVWTGSDMIVWGGDYGGSSSIRANTGGRYNPLTDSWTMTSTTGAPVARSSQAAIWTGREMIIWGGTDGTAIGFRSGGLYNPATDGWTSISTANAPPGSFSLTAVWTGGAMIVWGGRNDGSFSTVNTGGRYIVATAVTLAPVSQSFPANGGSGSITVTAQPGCPWTATSDAGWIAITSGNNGTGNGTVSFSIAATTVTTSRTATLTIGNQLFTVTQAGGVPTPVPTLSSISPTSTTVGSAPFTLMVTGTNFINSSMVRWNGNDRATTFVNGTQLTAAITAGDIAVPGTPTVTVFNPPPGGGASNALTFTTCGYAISPASYSFGDDAGTGSVMVTGPGNTCGGWTATSNANWITIISGTSGNGNGTVNYSVTAYTGNIPRTGTLTIASQTFTVTQIRQAVTVSAASYSGGTLASEAIVAAFGKNLATTTAAATTIPLPTTLGGTTIKVKDSNGAERLAPLFFVSPGQINYLIPSETANGTATITVTTGDGTVSMGVVLATSVAPGLFSANADGKGIVAGVALRVRPDRPVPILTSLNPNAVIIGSASFTLTVNGSNFINGSTVRLNGSDRPTTYISATQLRVAISTTDLTALGAAAVTVFNPSPGGGTSNELLLSVNNPVPTISSMSHATTTSGGPGFTLTVNGSSFLSNSVVRWNGQNKATTFVSNTRLMAEITATDLVAPGSALVTVFNPSPGGGTSSSLRIDIFDGSRDVRLTSGITLNDSFESFPVNACGVHGFPQYTIQVPFGANQLRISINGTQDMNLYVRFAQRVDFPSGIVADYKADGSGSSETITITPTSSPPLQAGTYYIAVGKCGTSAATFTLTATVTNGFGFTLGEVTSTPSVIANEPGRNGIKTFAAFFFTHPNQITYYPVTETLAGTVTAASLNQAKLMVIGTERNIAPPIDWQLFHAPQTLPADEQIFELVARYDSAQNKFVPIPIDLGADLGIVTDQVYLVLFGTGLRGRSDLSAVKVKIGNLDTPVIYAGAQGDFVGLDQINVGPLPRSLAGRGEIDVVVTIDGKTANTVKINIK